MRTYTFQELFTRNDLPHFRHEMKKAAQKANRDQRKLVRNYYKKLNALARQYNEKESHKTLG